MLAPATTSRKATSQSAAPATKKRHACIATLPKYCACHAKHENDLTFCDLGTPKRAFRARLPPLFILWKTGWCRSANAPPNGSELTSWRRRGDDDTTTTRRRGDDDTTTRQQNKANTGPTPDPNYKRETLRYAFGKKFNNTIVPNCANKCKINCHTIQYSKFCLSQVLFELSPDTKIHGFVSSLIFGRNATASPVANGPFEDVFPISYWKRKKGNQTLNILHSCLETVWNVYAGGCFFVLGCNASGNNKYQH